MHRVFLVFIIFASSTYADVPHYNSQTVVSYLRDSEVVAVVKKLNGALSFEEYIKIATDYSDMDEDSLYKIWRKNRTKLKDEFIVLKSYKGNMELGELFNATVADSITYLTKRSGDYLIFFQKDKEGLYYSSCDLFDVESSKTAFKQIHSLSEVISFTIKNGKLNCLYEKVE